MKRFLIILVLLNATINLAGCGQKSSPTSYDSPGQANTGQNSDSERSKEAPEVKPLPPEYLVLAKHLATEMVASPQDVCGEKTLSQIIAGGHSAVLDLGTIQSQDPRINYLAKLGQTALNKIVFRLERINALPKSPGQAELMVESFIHGLYGNPYYGYLLGVDATEKQKAIIDELQALLVAADEADAAHMMLPKVAEKYAAPISVPNGRILVDIDEVWGGHGQNDWFRIYNAGPDDLEDCTIEVLLNGKNGETRKNVHFVRSWPAKTWMHARYEPGKEILDRPDAGSQTVTGIQNADVTVWSPKFSTKLTYKYQGSEKDNDIADRCKEMTFTGRYQPFEDGILWDTYPGVDFWLNGIATVPKCRVDVTFRNDSKSRSWYWEHESWKPGEKKSFNTSENELEFEASHVDLAISFPGSSYKHEVTLTVD